ncbi:MAG: hypothetical protein N2578_06420 [Bdellovibrionaceae bacterium]|nr:hypothetical protein [Pseudobdellovibrionaceae bacterium]
MLLLSCPAKVFIAGEYLVLNGGPALVACLGPRFELEVSRGSGDVKGIHPDSPAGKLLASQSWFSDYDLRFIDPQQGRGGLGASTAQFLFVYALAQWKETVWEGNHTLSPWSLLESYQDFAWSGRGKKPSGADLLSQWRGGITKFSPQGRELEAVPWNFSGQKIYFLRTGEKVPTHDHLAELGDFSSAELERALRRVVRGLSALDLDEFANGIQAYGRELANLGFLTKNSLSLLHDLSWAPGVLAAKGCGAMGADFLLALVNSTEERAFKNWAGEAGLECLEFSTAEPGLQVRVQGNL